MEEKRVLTIALAASLLLHLLFGVATWRLNLMPRPDQAWGQVTEEEMEIVLSVDDGAGDSVTEANQPTQFTAVPDRLASGNPPENPDYLALHHSLAADQTQGGDGNTPAAEEESEFPQNRISREDFSGAQGVAYANEPLPIAKSGIDAQKTGDEGEAEKKPDESTDLPGEWKLPPPEILAGKKEKQQDVDKQENKNPALEDWWGGQAPSMLKEGESKSAGDRGFDFNQVARGMVGSGVAIDGDFSLNTYEWAYAPWMTRFENELHRHWMSPYAYRLGVISGKTVIKVVVEKDGRPSTIEIVDVKGHESLHDASVAALKAFAPYAALPANFPEEHLVITIGMHYPAWHK